MSKTLTLTSAVIAALLLSTSAHAAKKAAAAPSLKGSTWDLSGKLVVKAGAACKRGGGMKERVVDTRVDLVAQLHFNDDGSTFTWTSDNFATAGGTLTGDYTLSKNGAVVLDFDNPAASALRMQAELYSQTWGYGGNGLNATVPPVRYLFTAKLDSKKDRLKVSETTGFKINASASAYGQSNSCSFKLSLSRDYNSGARR